MFEIDPVRFADALRRHRNCRQCKRLGSPCPELSAITNGDLFESAGQPVPVLDHGTIVVEV